MKATFLSASGYTDPSKNNGDCSHPYYRVCYRGHPGG